ncbi:MAG: hypothetical protein IJZ67_06500 [Alistipes sp.]|nr:hypothetical protein [Alistipes sp.]
MDFFDFDGGDGLFEMDSSVDDGEILGLNGLEGLDDYNVSFMGSNSDGYIPNGTVTLERTISGIDESFKAYRNGGHIYVETSPNHFVQVDGSGTVKIHGVEYDKL